MEVRRGSNERDSSSSTEWSSPVMLSATDPSLRGGVTRCDCSNGQGLFFTIEPCLKKIMRHTDGRSRDIMNFKQLPWIPVGADLSRPSPIYRPRELHHIPGLIY